MLHLKEGLNQAEVIGNQPHLLLFDLSIYGHHPAYIRHLINYWHQSNLAGKLTIVVSPRFLTEHSDVVALSKHLAPERIHFLAITETEEVQLRPRNTSINRNIRNFQEWQLLCRYAQKLQADHALVLYYDTYQYYLALNFNPPCPVSGIYFRPTFHYSHFSTAPVSKRKKLQIYWEQFILNRVLQNSKLHTLFSLDPFVVNHISSAAAQRKLVYLPDPVELCQVSPSQGLREQLGIESHRRVLLLFGALTARKGIDHVLDAIPQLSPNLHEQLAIVMVGEASANYQEHLETKIANLLQRYPIQIVRHYAFVAEEEVSAYFQNADLVLATYQRHVGMSGILIQAAAVQKPVLSSDYGLMGELVKQYQLGLAVDTTQPEAIAAGIEQFLHSPDAIGDGLKMQQFANQNSATQFSATIFNRLNQTVHAG